MTEERKKYLAGISKEEWVIRNFKKEYKLKIKKYKFCLNNDCSKSDYLIFKIRIRNSKTIIKALKKQLPAPRKEIDIGLYWAILNCPICKTTIPIHAGYCLCCGQKLR